MNFSFLFPNGITPFLGIWRKTAVISYLFIPSYRPSTPGVAAARILESSGPAATPEASHPVHRHHPLSRRIALLPLDRGQGI